MARPKMQLSPEDAKVLIADLVKKLDDLDFCDRHLVKDENGIARSRQARDALKPLVEQLEASRTWRKAPIPITEEGHQQFRQWLAEYLTDAGWKRLLAAKRQRKVMAKTRSGSHEDREIAIAVPEMAAHRLSEMAQTLSLDRKQLTEQLTKWLWGVPQGKAAFEAFAARVQATQREEALRNLGDVFGLDHKGIRGQLALAGSEDQAREAELLLVAYRAGRSRLSKLANAFTELGQAQRWRQVVKPLDLLHGKTLLEATADGQLDDALAAIGAAHMKATEVACRGLAQTAGDALEDIGTGRLKGDSRQHEVPSTTPAKPVARQKRR